MALDATVGGASADSYATLIEAVTILGARLQTGAWDDAVEDVQEIAMRAAAIMLDTLDLGGYRVSRTQARRFPRYAVCDRDGFQIDSTTIPGDVKRAQVELSVTLLEKVAAVSGTSGANTILSALTGLSSVKVGSLEVKKEDSATASRSESQSVADVKPLATVTVRQLMAPYLRASPNSIRLIR